jgi:signal transduction histidine kinase
MNSTIVNAVSRGPSQFLTQIETEQLERRRIARLLCSRIKPLLVTAKLNVEKGLLFHPGEVGEQCLNATLRNIDECLHAARGLTEEMTPPAPQEKELAAVVRAQVEWLQKQYVHFQADLDIEDVTLHDVQAATILSEAVRELLLNAVEHSGVDSASVRVRKEQIHSSNVHVVELIVSDEGTGFDASRIGDGSRIKQRTGLTAIRQLIESQSGSFELESRLGGGTTARIRIVQAADQRPETLPPVDNSYGLA